MRPRGELPVRRRGQQWEAEDKLHLVTIEKEIIEESDYPFTVLCSAFIDEGEERGEKLGIRGAYGV
jgi:hypothetical protein